MPARIEKRVVILALSIALTGTAIGGLWATRVRADNVRKPFLLQWAVQDVQPDGSMQTTFLLTEAVRSDGASMHDSAVVADGIRPQREIILPGERKVLVYDPEINAAYSEGLSDGSVKMRTGPVLHDCLPADMKCVDEGKKVLGYPVLTFTRDFREANGTMRRIVESVAPQLDYQTLAVTFYKDGKLTGQRVPLYLAAGEPAPDLFTVPEGVEFIAKMSEMTRRSEAARGRPLTPEQVRKLEEDEWRRPRR